MAEQDLPTAPHLLAITPPDAARTPAVARRWAEGLREGLAQATGSGPATRVRVAIQVRDKQADDPQTSGLLDELRRQCPSIPVVLNGPPARAKRLGFDGFHLPAEGQEAIERQGRDEPLLLAGQSSHSIDEARQGASTGADYLVFGPVYDTPAKRRFGSPQGLTRLGEVCRAVAIPVLAIGGLDSSRIVDCWRAGAAGIAAIRSAGEATEVARMVSTLQDLMDGTIPG